jgi:competence protein ComGC
MLDCREKMTGLELLLTSLLTVLLILSLVSCLILVLLSQRVKALEHGNSQTMKSLIDLVEKQSTLLASKNAVEFQALQASDVEYQEYDPSDEGELARINRRNSALYTNNDSGLLRVDPQDGEYAGGNPYLFSP